MEAWNAAQLILDVSFGITVTLALVTFIYLRERRIRKVIADYVAGFAYQDQAPAEIAPAPAAQTVARIESSAINSADVTSFAPPLLSRYRDNKVARPGAGNPVESTTRNTPRNSAAMSRTEKYLEAVRMYRDGRRRDEIENSLGISFMELELLGQLK